jgi:hypothetical protein
MALALAVESVDRTRRHRTITYVPTFSGNYPGGAGETLDMLGATNPKNEPDAYPHAGVLPEEIQVEGAAGYSGTGAVGTALNNSKLTVQSAAATDLAAAAYPAGVTGADDKMRIKVRFPNK